MYQINMVIGRGGNTEVTVAGAVVNTTNVPALSMSLMIGNGAALTQNLALECLHALKDQFLDAVKRDQSAAVALKIELTPKVNDPSAVLTTGATVNLSAETKFAIGISQAGGKTQTGLYTAMLKKMISRLREDINLKLVLGVAA